MQTNPVMLLLYYEDDKYYFNGRIKNTFSELTRWKDKLNRCLWTSKLQLSMKVGDTFHLLCFTEN